MEERGDKQIADGLIDPIIGLAEELRRKHKIAQEKLAFKRALEKQLQDAIKDLSQAYSEENEAQARLIKHAVGDDVYNP